MRAYAVAPLGAQWSSTASRATVVASMRVLKWHGTESTASGGGGGCTPYKMATRPARVPRRLALVPLEKSE